MNIERLRLAQEILRGVDPTHFDLDYWVGHPDPDLPNMRTGRFDLGGTQGPVTMRRLLRIDCGSVGCAVGWIASDERVRQQGLSLEFDGYEGVYPCYREGSMEVFGWTAVELYYDLSSEDAERIFFAPSYDLKATPRDVIERIETVIAEGSTP